MLIHIDWKRENSETTLNFIQESQFILQKGVLFVGHKRES